MSHQQYEKNLLFWVLVHFPFLIFFVCSIKHVEVCLHVFPMIGNVFFSGKNFKLVLRYKRIRTGICLFCFLLITCSKNTTLFSTYGLFSCIGGYRQLNSVWRTIYPRLYVILLGKGSCSRWEEVPATDLGPAEERFDNFLRKSEETV